MAEREYMHRWLTTLLGVTVLACAASGQTNLSSRVVSLRGLGTLRVEARFYGTDKKKSWITFEAEDAEHAVICGSKFLADLTSLSPVRAVSDGNAPVTTLMLWGGGWGGAGSWVLGIENRRFHVVFAPTAEDAAVLWGEAQG
jgi:hypothetical protein